MKAKLKEKFSVISNYYSGSVTIGLVYNEGNILLNEFVKSVENEQEAKLMHHAYYSIMIEREMAIYTVIHHLAKVLDFEYKGKDANEVVKIIKQKVKELDRVKLGKKGHNKIIF